MRLTILRGWHRNYELRARFVEYATYKGNARANISRIIIIVICVGMYQLILHVASRTDSTLHNIECCHSVHRVWYRRVGSQPKCSNNLLNGRTSSRAVHRSKRGGDGADRPTPRSLHLKVYFIKIIICVGMYQRVLHVASRTDSMLHNITCSFAI